jgi:bisphosphoglycerate-dependent phosphoglycerate mutase
MQAPKLPTVFKQNKARGFDFKPRHYNENQERLKKLKERYKKEAKQTPQEKIKRLEIDEQFKSEWQDKRQNSVKTSNRVLLFIIAGLFLLTYYIIMY